MPVCVGLGAVSDLGHELLQLLLRFLSRSIHLGDSGMPSYCLMNATPTAWKRDR